MILKDSQAETTALDHAKVHSNNGSDAMIVRSGEQVTEKKWHNTDLLLGYRKKGYSKRDIKQTTYSSSR